MNTLEQLKKEKEDRINELKSLREALSKIENIFLCDIEAILPLKLKDESNKMLAEVVSIEIVESDYRVTLCVTIKLKNTTKTYSISGMVGCNSLDLDMKTMFDEWISRTPVTNNPFSRNKTKTFKDKDLKFLADKLTSRFVSYVESRVVL